MDNEHINEIAQEAKDILSTQGVLIQNEEAKSILIAHDFNHDDNRFYFPHDIIEKSLNSCPKKIKLYDREGNTHLDLSGDNIHYDPGSAAILFLDDKTGMIRKAQSTDFIRFTKIVNHLDNLEAQSTALMYHDVPRNAQDWHRLFVCLKYCHKPIVTGTFRKESFSIMKKLLLACRSSEENLQNKPLAIFDACPSPPLIWSDLTTHTVINAARSMIPVEFISMPLAGANAPITLIGAITQHCAETLSGIVISQIINRGAPIIWGGSPAIMDMKKGTTPMGAIETMMINIGNVQVGKAFGLPTHAYMSLSDSKVPDFQAGIESNMGALLAGLAGINMISGPGMLDFESTQSLEKLVIDNDTVGMVKRLINGISDYGSPFATEILKDYYKTNELLSHPTTLKHYKNELYFPSSIIDRNTRETWRKTGTNSARQRARKVIKNLEEKSIPHEIPKDVKKALEMITAENLS